MSNDNEIQVPVGRVFNHPGDEISLVDKSNLIFSRNSGTLDKSFKFEYHEYGSYSSLTSFNEPTERFILDGYWLYIIKEAKNIIDAGAGHGIYTLASLVSNEDIHVYAFEPVQSLANSLRNNIRLNDWEQRASVYSDRILWSHTTEKMIRFDEKVWTSGFQFDSIESVQFRDSIAIDDLNLPKIDAIKIDVEGSELEVLYGAIKLIRRDKPKLLIEIHDNFIPEMVQFIGYFFNISLQLGTDIKQFNLGRHYLIVEFK